MAPVVIVVNQTFPPGARVQVIWSRSSAYSGRKGRVMGDPLSRDGRTVAVRLDAAPGQRVYTLPFGLDELIRIDGR